MHQVTFKLTDAEHMALLLLADSDMRAIPQQVRFIVQQEVIRRGFLEPPTSDSKHTTGLPEDTTK